MTSMVGKDKTFEHVGKVLDAVDSFSKAVQWSEHDWHWKKLRAYAVGLFERAPFKVGDRVRLTKTPRIDEKHSWGLMGCKHYLVEGALATVAEVDFSDGHFEAWLHFDDETWKSSIDGQLHKPDRPALIHFWETSLERVEAAPCPTSDPNAKGGAP